MGKRSTVYNAGLTANWEKVNETNKTLLKDFLTYCRSTNHSTQTCYQYEAQMKIFLCYIEKRLGNKLFVDIRKRELVGFFGVLQDEYKMSPNRIASIKAVISSMSNYIVDILDDEYPTFHNITSSVKLAAKQNIRSKTVLEDTQIEELLTKLVEMKKYQVACFFAFIAYSGARKAEGVQALVSDFTDEHKVFHGKYWETHVMRTKGRGREGKPLKKYVEIIGFKPYLDLWLEERQKMGINCDELFVVFSQGEYHQASVATASGWAEIASKLINEDVYCHCFRHYFVSRARKNKVTDIVIQGLVGWSDASMISVYDDREITDTLSDYFIDDDDDDDDD